MRSATAPKSAVAGVLQHIEEAGVHSGDSACAIPPFSLSPKIIAEIERQTRALAVALEVKGLMNIQFAVKEERGLSDRGQSARQPHRAVRRESDRAADRQDRGAGHGRRETGRASTRSTATSNISPSRSPVFPFARFPGTDPVLGPEMKSTGEVMGIDHDFDIAFAKALLGAGMILPQGGTAFVSVKDADKDNIVPAVEKLIELGFAIIATGGTAEHLRRGLPVDAGQQGRAGAAAHRRPLARRRCRPGVQHHRGLAVDEGQPFDPGNGAGHARCPISQPRRRAWPPRGQSRRCAATRLKLLSLQSYYSASVN